VFLRIEGKSDTIFERPVSNGPTNVTTPSRGTHPCDGKNNDANPIPGATCITALDEAACEKAFAWDGTWFDQFSEYFVTSVGDTAQTHSQIWGLLLNYQFTLIGGCHQQTRPNDNVLWAFDAFSKAHFWQPSTDPDFATPDGTTISITHIGSPIICLREGWID
jgi:hypothetical protein